MLVTLLPNGESKRNSFVIRGEPLRKYGHAPYTRERTRVTQDTAHSTYI